MAEQAGGFALAHTAAAADTDNRSLVGILQHDCLELFHQNGEDQRSFFTMRVVDFDFISGHIAVHDLAVNGRELRQAG